MSLAADKKLWDKLHEDLKKKSEALLAYEIELGTKYGHNFQTQWLSTAQKKKLEKLRDAKEKTGEKIYELVSRISPRQWDRGVPSWWVRSELTWEDAIRPKNEPLSVIVPGSYGVPDGTVKETPVEQDPETAGINYATAQLESDYFMDWVRDQLLEASKMPPEDVLPLETKRDARVIAKNMLQQLEWDAKRDLRGRDILEILGPDAAARSGDSEPKPALVAEFFDGFHRGLTNPSTVDWLADELLEIKSKMSGRSVGEARRSGTLPDANPLSGPRKDARDKAIQQAVDKARETGEAYAVWMDRKGEYHVSPSFSARWEDIIAVAHAPHGHLSYKRYGASENRSRAPTRHVRDYIAIDSHDRPVGPRHKGYSGAKRDADNAGGTVKFVPSSKRAPVREMRRPKAGRSVTRRRR